VKGLLSRQGIVQAVQIWATPLDSVASIDELPQATNVPESIQSIIQHYSKLFQDPTSLPPMRSQDHHIPLIPGARPVNVRPYRCCPQQKTDRKAY
jgi:hypothetical protein